MNNNNVDVISLSAPGSGNAPSWPRSGFHPHAHESGCDRRGDERQANRNRAIRTRQLPLPPATAHPICIQASAAAVRKTFLGIALPVAKPDQE